MFNSVRLAHTLKGLIRSPQSAAMGTETWMGFLSPLRTISLSRGVGLHSAKTGGNRPHQRPCSVLPGEYGPAKSELPNGSRVQEERSGRANL